MAIVDDPRTIEVSTKDRREVILSYGKEDTQPRRSAMIVLSATSEMDLDEIRDLLSKLITLTSVKDKPDEGQAPKKVEEPDTVEAPAAKESSGEPATP